MAFMIEIGSRGHNVMVMLSQKNSYCRALAAKTFKSILMF